MPSMQAESSASNGSAHVRNSLQDEKMMSPVEPRRIMPAPTVPDVAQNDMNIVDNIVDMNLTHASSRLFYNIYRWEAIVLDEGKEELIKLI